MCSERRVGLEGRALRQFAEEDGLERNGRPIARQQVHVGELRPRDLAVRSPRDDDDGDELLFAVE